MTRLEEHALYRFAATAAFLTIILSPLTIQAHEGDEKKPAPAVILGVLDFPNSGAVAAQDAFRRGVMLLHSFEFDDARDAFIDAQQIDPEFAMAIWGEAMTLNHPLWERQDRDAAREVLTKLAATGTRRTTAREEGYINAVFVLFGDGSKPQRDAAYREAMRQLHETYPDDLEAAAFYALSILGSVYERDFRTFMLAASVAEDVFAKQPQHPGAAHYLIHSYDDQIHAPLGLRAAKAYSKIAPDAAHAQHMVSHIYTSLGMWSDVVDANVTAVRVSEESMLRAGRDPAKRSKHPLQWLQYALLQQGRIDDARDALQKMRADVLALPDDYNRRYNAYMRAGFAVESPLSPSILQPTDLTGLELETRAVDVFATAFKQIANGDIAGARAQIQGLQDDIDNAIVVSVEGGLHENDGATSEDGYLVATVILQELRSLVNFSDGEIEQALQTLGGAVEDAATRPLEYGPPTIPKPASELLGEMLWVLGRPDEAIEQFKSSLERNTGRTQSLLGLARAQEAVGDAEATQTWQQLLSQWQADDDTLRAARLDWLNAPTTIAADLR